MNTIGLARRTQIRIISFLVAIISALAIWGITQTIKTRNYAREMTIAHQRTVTSLASYIDTLENDLRKMQYANTSPMTSVLSLSLLFSVVSFPPLSSVLSVLLQETRAPISTDNARIAQSKVNNNFFIMMHSFRLFPVLVLYHTRYGMSIRNVRLRNQLHSFLQ